MSTLSVPRLLFGVFLFPLLALACDAAPQAPVEPPAPEAAVTFNERFFTDVVIFNICTGEDVHWQGYEHRTISMTADDAGGFHMHFINNWNGIRGVGLTTGRTYRATGITDVTQNVKPPFPVTMVVRQHLQWVSHGPASDAVGEALQVLTVNANGDVVVDQPYDFQFTCR